MAMSERYSHRAPSREARRAQFKRRVRLKKLAALSVLFLMFAICISIIAFVVSGIIRFSKSRKMVEEPYTAAQAMNLVLVDNTGGRTDKVSKTDYFAPLHPEDAEYDEDDIDGEDYYADMSQISGGEKGLIIVDAGHGGKDSGALGNERMEKDIVLDIAFFARKALIAKGFSVYMTRVDDTFVGLNERAVIANSLDPLAMVSIHLNSFPDLEEVAGIEGWTYERSGCIELADALTRYVALSTGADNRGVSYATNLVVTSKTKMPSVILECGYITNPRESDNLVDSEYQKKIALGIAKAVDVFVDDYYK